MSKDVGKIFKKRLNLCSDSLVIQVYLTLFAETYKTLDILLIFNHNVVFIDA